MNSQSATDEVPQLRLDPESAARSICWSEVFGRDGEVEIEIGLGKGRFILAAAELRPDVLHFGIEWANKYLRIAEARTLRRGLSNVRFVRADAGEIVRAIPDASVSAFYVFYPDPWPKKRHHKRRFLRQSNLEQLARAIRDGGRLHVATDHVDYWAAIEEVLSATPEFERLPEFGEPPFPLPVEEPLTNFEAKYRIEGRARNRASWQRRSRES